MKNWTLFLDRDGVINRRLVDHYVTSWKDFHFTDRCLEAMGVFAENFHTIVVVTNQQGIGKGLMTENELKMLHQEMIAEVESAGGQIDKVYYCPHHKEKKCNCRKPKTGMAWQAMQDFPIIDFSNSIMVGDSFSDMEFGWQLGMKTIFIEGENEENERTANFPVDGRFENLWEFSQALDQFFDPLSI